MSSREESKARTRAALAEAAERLAIERGFDALTVEDIADAAGVSRRTFFRYFSSKEDAFLHRQEQTRLRFERMVAGGLGSGSPHALLREGLLELCDEYQAIAPLQHARAHVLYSSDALMAADLALDHRWEKDFAIFLESASEPFTASVQACALMGAVRATLRAWFEAGPDAQLKPIAERALETLDAGLPMGRAHHPLTHQEPS